MPMVTGAQRMGWDKAQEKVKSQIMENTLLFYGVVLYLKQGEPQKGFK